MGRINSCLLSSYAQFTDKPLPVKGFRPDSHALEGPCMAKEGLKLCPRGNSVSEIEESRSLEILSHSRRYS